jgi:hypothetical protein
MIWPFSKREWPADRFLTLMPELIDRASEKWLYFCQTLKFKEGTPLVERITSFAIPAIDGMKRIPELKDTPESMLLLVVALGIVRSGTHTKEEVENALGTELPEANF